MIKLFKKKSKKTITGHLDGYDGYLLRGWAVSTDNLSKPVLSITINDKEIKTFIPNKFRSDLKAANLSDGNVAFTENLALENIVKEYGNSCTLRIKEKKTGQELTGSPIHIGSPDLIWYVETYTADTCKGWIVDKNNTFKYITLKVYIDGELMLTTTANIYNADLEAVGIESSFHGFDINLAGMATGKVEYSVRVEAEYGDTYVIAPEEIFLSFYKSIKALTDLQHYLRANNYGGRGIEQELLVKSILPGVIDKARKSHELVYADFFEVSKIDNRTVAIIVPVYKGIEETISCLSSVFNSKNSTLYRVIVINDCSPEIGMQNALDSLKDDYPLELIINEHNLGFVGTANRGMRLAEQQDVILLNSDTVVADGWLDAITKVAKSSEEIATVTPISNNATICSFPNFCSDNELPEGYDVAALARLCASNTSEPVELPTAHGYCMFIKRQALNEIGYFDEQAWGKGYGEENDFSMRATKLGWKHVSTNKTFIQHIGSVSFAEDAAGFIENNLSKLNDLYPDYPGLVQEFVINDPMRRLRNELAEKLLINELNTASVLAPAKGKAILFVSLSFGGGTKKSSDDLARMLAREGQAVFLLTTKDNIIWNVQSYKSNISVQFKIAEEKSEFFSFLQQLDIWQVHYQHWLEFGSEVWGIPEILNCGYRVTLHDYYSVCPRVEFLTFDDKYCENEATRDCNSCIQKLGAYPSSYNQLENIGSTVESWREYSEKKLSQAESVIVPSQDTKQRIERYISLKNIEVIQHSEEEKAFNIIRSKKNQSDEINIGFVGALGYQKGLSILKNIAHEIKIKQLNIKLTVIGYTSDNAYLEQFDFVSIIGAYDNRDLNRLLNESAVDVVFLSSITPETFGYTYAEVINQGTPVVAFKHGAIVERADPNAVRLLALDLTPAEILLEIKSFLSNDINAEGVVGKQQVNVLQRYYS